MEQKLIKANNLALDIQKEKGAIVDIANKKDYNEDYYIANDLLINKEYRYDINFNLINGIIVDNFIYPLSYSYLKAALEISEVFSEIYNVPIEKAREMLNDKDFKREMLSSDIEDITDVFDFFYRYYFYDISGKNIEKTLEEALKSPIFL
jgi:hypothetical protein